MKNILLIHLESLNYLNYMMNERYFSFIRRIEESSILFTNYYSTATSTFMVMGDLAYGDKRQFESCKKLREEPQRYMFDKSLFDCLKEKGINTKIVNYPVLVGGQDAEKRHYLGFTNNVESTNSYTEYMRLIEEGIDIEPFAILAGNFTSNIDLNKIYKVDTSDYKDNRLVEGYKSVDRYVKDVFDLLEKKGKIENTTVILYGDHGDDYWTHGIHGGLSHAIEPNALLIHTPLLIWDAEIGKKKIIRDVCDTESISLFIKSFIEYGKVDEEDLKNKCKEYIISRNEFSAQEVRTDTFNKAYSIADGKYLLMVTSKGMTMFDVEMDQDCHNNLLRFFELDDGYLYKKEMDLHRHIKSFFNNQETRSIRQSFYFLHKRLYEETLGLFQAGLLDEEAMNQQMKFDSIDYLY